MLPPQSRQVSQMFANFLGFLDDVPLRDDKGLVAIDLRLVQLLLLLALFVLFHAHLPRQDKIHGVFPGTCLLLIFKSQLEVPLLCYDDQSVSGIFIFSADDTETADHGHYIDDVLKLRVPCDE
mmetsp:Transcript_10087/g.12680  ORF Transcript_10087/g.12680 Transcript_10087/m.12680 type:complete len:123 (+) Transcript_10087:797-1165(+)